jgi:tetratricopeptide (TPR) repeat protein
MMRTLCCSIVVVIASASAAAAQPTHELSPAAKQHLDAGVAAYRANDFDTANRELEAAYAIDPDPTLLYTMAQARRLGGDCSKAIELYRQYIESKPSDAQIAATNTGIELCREKEPAKPPTPAPPSPRIVPPAPPVEGRTRPWYQNTLGDALTIGGVAGIGVGIGFLIASGRGKDRALAADLRDDFETELARATRQRGIGFVAIGAGSALVAGGVLAYVLRPAHDSRLAMSTDGHTVYVAGSF